MKTRTLMSWKATHGPVQVDEEQLAVAVQKATSSAIAEYFSATPDLESPHLLSPDEIAHCDRFALERRVRALCTNAFLGDDTSLCRILGRYKFFVDTKDVGFASHLMLDGIWEPWITQFVAAYAKPGMTVVDVGANFGYYTVLLADIVGDQGEVIAIEPSERAHELCTNSISVNGLTDRVRFVQSAVGASDEMGVAFFIPDGEPKNARLVSADQAHQFAGGVMEKVRVTTLDHSLADCKKVDFIKIDVEGAEEGVIRGATNIIQKHSPTILLEFNQDRCESAHSLLQDLRASYPKLDRISPVSGIETVSDEDILTAPSQEDQMLILYGGGECRP